MARFRSWRWWAGASALTLGMMINVGQASAQSASDDNDEVIVTSQRRAEALQDVPIAIDAFGQNEIEKNAIVGLQDLTGRSAGVFFRPLNAAMPNIFVRGVGSTQADNSSDQSTGVFQDEVYVARHSALSSELFDLERIEVLKGPQGTLYGRNTIGGAINIITSAPTEDLEGYLGASYGSFNAVSTRGAISGPLTQSLLGRFAFVTSSRDGYSDNPVTHQDANDKDTMAARGRLRFEPNDRLTVDLSIDGVRDRAGPYEAKLLGTTNLAGVNQIDPSPGAPFATQDAITEPFTTHANQLGHQDRDIWGTSAQVRYAFSDALSLTSITAYRDSDSNMRRDLDNGPADLLWSDELESGHQFSQELRLGYDSGPLHAIAGVYYFKEESDRLESWHLGTAVVAAGGALQGAYNYAGAVSATNYAAFGQIDYDVLKNLTLTLGLRYSHDEKTADFRDTSTATVPAPTLMTDQDPSDPDQNWSLNVSHSWQSLDPSLTLSWHVTPDAMVYASYKEGYKSGGFQTRPLSPSVARDFFNPETMRSIEAGARTDWLDGALRANVSAFHYDYKEMQQINLFPGTVITVTDNIGSAKIDGVELELTARPTHALTVNANFSWLDATIDKYIDGAGINYAGHKLPRAPETAVNLSADYTFPTTSIGSLNAHLEYEWRDDLFFLVNNNPIDHAPDVGLLNARLTLSSPSDRWTWAVYGSNLTDEEYCANYSTGAPSGPTLTNPTGAGFCAVGAPQEFGVSLQYAFH